MSWVKSSIVVVVALVLMAFTSEAFAEHVDWSSYIDPNPSKPVTSKSVSVASDDAPVAKSSAKSKKRVAKKATSKKAKKAARAKKRR